MSARDWRAVREGETHAATKTSANRTPESFIVGVGASGILLAGAAIVFVTLVGLVSFKVWPTTHGGGGSDEPSISVDLGAAKPAPPANVAPVSAAAGLLASANPAVPPGGGASPGAGTGGGGGNGGGGGHGHGPGNGGNLTPAQPPATTPAPPSGGSTGSGSGNAQNPGNAGDNSGGGGSSGGGSSGGGSSGGGSSGGGNSGQGSSGNGHSGNGHSTESSHPVHPTHPSHSSQNQTVPVVNQLIDPTQTVTVGDPLQTTDHGHGHGPKEPKH